MSTQPSGPRTWYPKRLGRFRVRGIIAQGSAGLVLMAEDEDRSKVAIKLADQLGGQALRRFNNEIDATRRLNHAGIIRIRGVGDFDGRPWYAMDYHGGATLRDLITCNRDGFDNDIPSLVKAIQKQRLQPATSRHRRLMPQNVAVNLIMDIGRAIAHAHGRGLIHRDLKPENVLIRGDGRPVVCDFGLVKDLSAESANTGTGRFLGTIGYLAPEQREASHQVDERVDVYALGVMLDELVTGKAPQVDVFSRRLVKTEQAIHNKRIGRDLRLVIARATHHDPLRRYHSMQALVSDLERLQRGEKVRAGRDPVWSRALAWTRRHRQITVIAALLMIAALTIFTTRWIQQQIEAATWSSAQVHLVLNQADDLAKLDDVLGRWHTTEDGIEPQTTGSKVWLLAHPTARASALRISVTLQLNDGNAAIPACGLFSGNATSSLNDGYYWQLGAYGNSCSILWRDGRCLWIGRHRLQNNRSYRLDMIIDENSIHGQIDGQQLFHVHDRLPLLTGRWGLRIDSESQLFNRPRFAQLSMRTKTVPAYQQPSEYPRRLLEIFNRANNKLRMNMWPGLEAACLSYRDSRQSGSTSRVHADRLLLEAYLLLQAAGKNLSTDKLRHLDSLLEAVPETKRDLIWLELTTELHWPQGDHQRLLQMIESYWQEHPAERNQMLAWFIRLAEQHGDDPLLPRAMDLVTDTQLNRPGAWLLAHRLLTRTPWHGERGDRAAALLSSSPEIGTPLRQVATDRLVWEHLLSGKEVQLPPNIEERWNLFAPQQTPDSDNLVARLVQGTDPAARFDFDIFNADNLLTDADRTWLSQGINAVLPSLYSWSLPGADHAALTKDMSKYLQGSMDIATLAQAWRKHDPNQEPPGWHRLVACRLLLADRPEDKRLLQYLLPMAGMDLWALGLLWYRHDDQTERLDSTQVGPGLQNFIMALRNEETDAAATVPEWHPSRPLLELLLAWHEIRQDKVAAAQRRLEWLADIQAGWPESAAAAVMLKQFQR